MNNFTKQMERKLNELEWVVKPKKFKDSRTGEIVTQFLINDIKYMNEVK